MKKKNMEMAYSCPIRVDKDYRHNNISLLYVLVWLSKKDGCILISLQALFNRSHYEK